jgi:hypothetical protein
VVEQPQRCVRENDPVLVCRLDTLFVHDTPRRRSEVPHATLTGAMDVVREREEGIAGAGNAVQLLGMLRTFLGTERRRDLVKQALPVCFFAAFQYFAANEKVYRVRLVRTLDSFLERECKHALVVAQPPVVGFGACEPRAVDARLLSSAQSDD